MFSGACNFTRLLRSVRLCGMALAALLLALSSGCSLMQTCGCSSPPPAPINHVTSIWFPHIHYVADTQNHGARLPGLAGRVYLESDEAKKMVEADGMVYAEMYDATPGVEGKKLADWTFHRDSLKLLKKEDFVGLGYTLFLPWKEYRPEIKQVQIRVTYYEKNGAHHLAEPQIVALTNADEAPILQQVEYEYVPGHRQGLPTAK